MPIDYTQKKEVESQMGDINPNEQLTDNFKLSEFLKTSYPVANNPSQDAVDNLRTLAYQLQALRDEYGPIGISSGYRSPELQNYLINVVHNVNAASYSLHEAGMAADIFPGSGSKYNVKQLFAAIVGREDLMNRFGGVAILEDKGIIHIELPSGDKLGVPMYAGSDGQYYRFNTEDLQSFINDNPLTAAAIGGGLILLLAGLGVGSYFLYKKYAKK